MQWILERWKHQTQKPHILQHLESGHILQLFKLGVSGMVKSCPYLQAKCSQKQKKVKPPVPCTLPWAVKRSKAHPLSPVKSVKAKGQRSKARERERHEIIPPHWDPFEKIGNQSLLGLFGGYDLWIYDSYGSMDLWIYPICTTARQCRLPRSWKLQNVGHPLRTAAREPQVMEWQLAATLAGKAAAWERLKRILWMLDHL